MRRPLSTAIVASAIGLTACAHTPEPAPAEPVDPAASLQTEAKAAPDTIDPLAFARSADWLTVTRPGALKAALVHMGERFGMPLPIDAATVAASTDKFGWGGPSPTGGETGLLAIALTPPTAGLDVERPILTAPIEAVSSEVRALIRDPDLRVARALWPTTDSDALADALLGELSPTLGLDPTAQGCGGGCTFYSGSGHHLAFQTYTDGAHLQVALVRGGATPPVDRAHAFADGLPDVDVTPAIAHLLRADVPGAPETPALRAALDADLAVWLAPGAPFALVQQPQLDAVAAFQSASPDRVLELYARGAAQLMNVALLTDPRGAEFDDMTLRLHTAGDGVVDLVLTRTAHGEAVADALRPSGGAPQPRFTGEAVLKMDVVGDLGAMREIASATREAYSPDLHRRVRDLRSLVLVSGAPLWPSIVRHPMGWLDMLGATRDGAWMVPPIVSAQLVLTSIEPIAGAVALVFPDVETRDGYQALLAEAYPLDSFVVSTELPGLDDGRAALILASGTDAGFEAGPTQLEPTLRVRVQPADLLAAMGLPAGELPPVDLEVHDMAQAAVVSLAPVGARPSLPGRDGFAVGQPTAEAAAAAACATEFVAGIIDGFEALEHTAPNDRASFLDQVEPLLADSRACAVADPASRLRVEHAEAALVGIAGFLAPWDRALTDAERDSIVARLGRSCAQGSATGCALERACGMGVLQACDPSWTPPAVEPER